MIKLEENSDKNNRVVIRSINGLMDFQLPELQRMTSYHIHKELLINAPLNKVWEALTNPALVREYMFGAEVICDWSPGSEIIFQGEHQGTSYRDKGIILSCKVEQLLEYSYFSSFSGLEDKPENYSIVSYSLSGMDDGETTLTLHQKNLPSKEASIHADASWEHALSQLKEIAER